MPRNDPSNRDDERDFALESGRFGALKGRNLLHDLVVLVLAAAAIWIGYRSAAGLPGLREREITRWHERLTATADLKALAIERWAAELRIDAAVIAAFPSVRAEAEGRKGDAHLGSILEDMRRRHDYVAVRLVSRDGVPFDDQAADAIVPDVLRAPLPDWPVTLEVTGPRAVAVAVAPVGETGAFVVVLVDPEPWLYHLLRQEPLPTASGESLLVRRTGDSVRFVSPLRHGAAVGVERSDASVVRPSAASAALNGHVGVGEYVDYRSERVLAATRRVPGTDWGLVVKVDLDELLDAYRERRGVRALALGTALMALLTLGTLVFRGERERIRRRLTRVQDRFRAVLDQAGDVILFIASDSGQIRSANRAAEELYRRTADELLSMNIADLRTPEAIQLTRRDMERIRDHGQHLFETVHRDADGNEIPVEVNARHLELDGEGLFLSVIRDARRRKEAEREIHNLVRFLRTTTEVSRLLIHERDRATVFDEICRIAVETGEFTAAFIAVPRPSGEVSIAAAAGAAADYLHEITLRWDDTPGGKGPTGRAMRSGEAVVLDDVEADDSFAVWRDTARRHGFRSSIALPLHLRGEVAGVLNIYSTDLESFRGQTFDLVTAMAADVSFSLELLQRTAELETTRRQLREAEAIAHLGTCIRWLDTDELECSDEILQLLGVAPGTPADHGLRLDRVHPDDRDRVTRALDSERVTLDFRIVRPDGSQIWVECRMRRLAIDGRPCRSFTILDITERKKAESKLRAFSEAAPIGAINGHLDGRVLSANDEFLRIIGRSREDLDAGLVRWDAITPPEWNAADAAGVAEALAHGACIPYRKEFLRPDGSRVPVIVGYGISEDEKGESITFILDLTTQVQAEEDLKRLNTELEERVAERTAALETANRDLRHAIAEAEDLYENAPVAYHSLDAQGRYVRVNDTELQWLDYTREELLGRHASEVTAVEPDVLTANVRRVAAEGKLVFEVDMRRKDGSLLPVLITAVALNDEDGNFVMTRSSMIDNTERKTLLRELNNRNAALETAVGELEAFSYSVSHDLRAPLRAIDGFAQILAEEYAPRLDGEAKRIIGVIRGGVTKMGVLIDDLLRLSRASRAELIMSTCDMAALARKAVDQEPDRERVEVRIADLPRTACDSNLMLQVWTNLVSNAFKFTRGRDGRRIEISAESNASHHVYRVRDNGAGFDSRYSNKLFHVFQRLHSDQEFEGTGIGLALVRRIVERHGGEVGASSSGNGAEFWFSLPKQRRRKA